MLDTLLIRLRNEPALVAGAIAGVLVLLAGHFNIVLDKATITDALVPVIVGIVTRFQVTPNGKVPPAPAPVSSTIKPVV